jgi:hypothetical protein
MRERQMLKKITNIEYQMIDFYRTEYASYGKKDNVNFDNFITSQELLTTWEANKKTLYHLLDNNLILEKEIQCDNSYELKSLIQDLLKHPFCIYIQDQLFHLYFNDIIDYSTQSLLSRIITKDTLFSNKIFEDNPDNFIRKIDIKGKELVLCKNKKLIKTIKEFLYCCEATPDIYDLFEDFRLAHSRILNTKKTDTVVLTLSIHPLDFFTLSDNQNKWKSCLSWKEVGLYRLGTVEMMNSPCVLVAYVKSKTNNLAIGDNSWNSKIWRSLVVVEDDFILCGTNYPYEDKVFSQETVKWIKDLAHQGFPNEDLYDKDFIMHDGQICDKDNNILKQRIWFDLNYMYNDFFEKDNYDFIGILKTTHLPLYEDGYNIAGPVQCMICGQTRPIVEDYLEYEDADDYNSRSQAQYLCCSNCEELYYCPECDTPISKNNGLIIVDKTEICLDCATFEVVNDINNEKHLRRNVVAILVTASKMEDTDELPWKIFIWDEEYQNNKEIFKHTSFSPDKLGSCSFMSCKKEDLKDYEIEYLKTGDIEILKNNI